MSRPTIKGIPKPTTNATEDELFVMADAFVAPPSGNAEQDRKWKESPPYQWMMACYKEAFRAGERGDRPDVEIVRSPLTVEAKNVPQEDSMTQQEIDDDNAAWERREREDRRAGEAES